ncbi:MAG: hypothetical protein M1831_005601 [Alyxoria varia]|nr:MAG: hypothetical protein M1831_005601 [Alyxoria varia]
MSVYRLNRTLPTEIGGVDLLDAMRSTIAQYDSTRHDSSAFPDQTPEQFPGGVPGNFPGAQSGLSQPTGNSQNQRQSTSITPWSLLGAQAGSDQPAGSRTQPILQVVWADHSPDLLPLERYPDANEAKKIYQTLVSHLFDRFMPKFEGDRNKKSRVRHLQVVETGARDIPVLGTGFMVRVLFRNERNKVFPGQFPSQEAPGFLTDFPINVSDDFAWSPLHYRVVRTAPNHPQTNERPFLRDWLRTRLAAGVDEELSPSDVANSMGGILRTGNIFFTLGFRVYYTPEGLPAMPAQEMQVERSVREHFNVLNALAPSSELVLGQGYFQAHDMVQARANLIEA